MDTNVIIDYINKPYLLMGKADIDSLSSAIEAHPYCQVLHILTAIAKNQTDSIYKDDHLEKAAIYVNSRTMLYRRIVLKDLVFEKNLEQEDIKPKLTSKAEDAQSDRTLRSGTSALIDKFIAENPTIRKPKAGFFSAIEKANQSISGEDEFATETLANIYIKTGKIEKAIKIYEKLSLLYPEKRDYFALLIEMLKNKTDE